MADNNNDKVIEEMDFILNQIRDTAQFYRDNSSMLSFQDLSDINSKLSHILLNMRNKIEIKRSRSSIEAMETTDSNHNNKRCNS